MKLLLVGFGSVPVVLPPARTEEGPPAISTAIVLSLAFEGEGRPELDGVEREIEICRHHTDDAIGAAIEG